MKKLAKDFLREMRIGAISLTAIAAPFSFSELRADVLEVDSEVAQQSNICLLYTSDAADE